MDGITPFWDWARSNARIRNEYVLGAIGEFFATGILCLFGVAAACQALLTDDYDGYKVLWGNVLGLMIAITVFGGLSGAHVNPAVTLALAIAGKISWIKFPIYFLAQFFGGYLASGLAFAVYVDEMEKKCGTEVKYCKPAQTIWAPPVRDTIGMPLLDQVIGTCVLLLVILAAIDQRNMKVPKHWFGPLFALTVMGIDLSFGYHAGGVLNPARDMPPRLMALTVGFETKGIMRPEENDVQYWVAPFFGPLLGGALAAILYVLLVGAHLADENETEQPQRMPEPPRTPYTQNPPPQVRPDWRNTDVRKIPPASMGPASPPPGSVAYGHGGNFRNNNNNNNNNYY